MHTRGCARPRTGRCLFEPPRHARAHQRRRELHPHVPAARGLVGPAAAAVPARLDAGHRGQLRGVRVGVVALGRRRLGRLRRRRERALQLRARARRLRLRAAEGLGGERALPLERLHTCDAHAIHMRRHVCIHAWGACSTARWSASSCACSCSIVASRAISCEARHRARARVSGMHVHGSVGCTCTDQRDAHARACACARAGAHAGARAHTCERHCSAPASPGAGSRS